MKDSWMNQSDRITQISKYLRKEYYKNNEEEECYFETPDGVLSSYGEQYDMVGSIGPWPELILRGTFCCRTFKGFCSPCFYSQFSLKNRTVGSDYRAMIRQQLSYIIENFEEEVYNRQYGWKYLYRTEDRKIEFVLTPTGSYFDGNEFPQDLRLQMLHSIREISEKYTEPVSMMIESHIEDWVALDFDDKKTKEEIELLQKLNATVIFGFESANEYIRNVLYNKHLEMNDITRAQHLIKKHKLKMGVFIFAGLFSMNDSLTYEDVMDSLEYAISREITPVIMFQNIQTHTINDILFRNDKVSLIEPFTVMNIVSGMIELCERYNITDWLIADPKGGPPTPKYNIFDCARLTPREYSEQIYGAIVELRRQKDFNIFKEISAEIRKSDEYSNYLVWLRSLYNRDELETKTSELLDCAEASLEDRL